MAIRRPSVRIAQAPAMQRKLRSPRHTFKLKFQPFQIQPFLIAPVLPGETMKNFVLQAKTQIFSLRDFASGWWCEYYVFYVKHRDMSPRDEFVKMALDPTWNPTPAGVAPPAPKVEYYTQANGGVDWVKWCHEAVTNNYFRDQDETSVTPSGLLGGVPMAHIDYPGWVDSLLMQSDYATEDIKLMEITPPSSYDGDDVLTMSEFERAKTQWELLRMGNLTNQSYDEFLATYGVRMPAQELHRPELLRYVRDWKYPTTTIDSRQGAAGPTGGQPVATVQWSTAERADKDRYFTEPGFIFGVTVVRPKMLWSGQASTASQFLDNVRYWLPAVLREDPTSSIRSFTDVAGGGPLGALLTEAYVADMRDLFVHGDQFINFALTDARSSLAGLPNPSGARRYVAQVDIDGLFDAATGLDAYNGAYADGVVSFNIASTVEDTSDTSLGSVA